MCNCRAETFPLGGETVPAMGYALFGPNGAVKHVVSVNGATRRASDMGKQVKGLQYRDAAEMNFNVLKRQANRGMWTLSRRPKVA